jgi:uncharacterized repeat protein (TIGR01451 family)
VAIGDFNGDGKSDLAVANQNSDNVSILLGTGAGTFGAATNFVVGTRPISVAIGDFNGDGKSDLAAANRASNNVTILPGTGSGTFGAATSFAVGANPTSVAIGDFNGDGKSDLAAANRASANVSILLNAFCPPTVTAINPTSGSNAGGTVVTITGTNFVVGATTVAFGGSAGTSVSCASITQCTATSPAGSGTVDVTVTTAGGTSATSPADQFTYFVPVPVVTSINPSTGPTAGGTVVTITGSNFVIGPATISFGATAGTSATCSSTTLCTATSPAGSGTVSVRVTAASGTSANTAADDFTYTAPATACTTFSPATNFSAGTNPFSVAIGDFNGDGKSDLAVANQFSDNVSILLGTGAGTFGAATNFAVGTDPRSVAIGDFNGDGKSDLAVANQASNNVSILLGTGTGTFGAATNLTAGANPTFVAIGDFNGDGKSDLATANQNSGNVSILLGTGTGTFGAATNFTVGTTPSSVAIGDFNGDGKSDLAVANFSSNNVSILLGTGTGTLGAATNLTVGTSPYSVAIGDFNGDGISDLAVANYGSATVSILPGTGTGTFGAVTDFSAGTNPSSVAIGDFNGDGKSDLAVTNQGSDDVSILLGTGAGTFGAATNFTAGSNPFRVAIDDFNGDGKSDLAVANVASNDVSILLNSTTPGTLALSSATYSVNENAGPVTITVNRTGGSDCTAAVNYATSNGSATAGSDYTTTNGTLTFGPGVTTQSFTVPITDDSVFEGNETFNVTLSAPTGGATLGGPASAVVTIADNETQPALSIGNVTLSEGNSGTTAFTFPVILSGPSASIVTVNFATADGTTVAPGDYAANSGVLTFTPGVTLQNAVVQVVGDTTNEANEIFTVTLSTPSNATIATGTGTGTIQNDDGVPTLSIDSPSQAEGNSGTAPMNFSVTLSAISGQTVTVAYATADGTATAGSDYTTTSGTLTFAPGVTTQTIAVPISGDTTFEPNETFTVTLSLPANATIATGTGTGTIQNDDAGNADLSITKTASGGAFAGQTLTYNIAVANAGPNNAAAVVVTDVLPAGVTFVSATPTQGSCSGTTTITCNLGALANGGSASIVLQVTPAASGPLSNTASVSAAPQPDPNNANDQSTSNVTVLPASSIPALGGWAKMLLALTAAMIGLFMMKKE